MKLRNLIKNIFWIISIIGVFAACSKHDDPVPSLKDSKRVIMIYMLSDNSLRTFDRTDILEMKKALATTGYDTGTKIVIYRDSVRASENVVANSELLELVEPTPENPGGIKVIKSYPDSPSSATPERLGEVIDDVKSNFPAEEYGAFFWSHAAAWKPVFRTMDNNISKAEGFYTLRRNFGDDAGKTLNIDEMASAIPDKAFKFIWMDCCYMANMETIYQFRNKCDFYIGYPTEVLGEGCPYDKVLPFLISPEIDLAGAANAMFNSFASLSGSYASCTIGVFDMSKIAPIADAFRNAVNGFYSVSTNGLLKYSRFQHGPFYDIMGYIERSLEERNADNADSLLYDLRKALDNATLFKKATPRFLNTIIIPEDKYFAISIHIPGTMGEKEENYYKTLDWYRDTYMQVNNNLQY